MSQLTHGLRSSIRSIRRRPLIPIVAVTILALGLAPVIFGLVVGLVVSFGVTRLVRGLLYGVEPTDPLSLAGGAIVLVLAAVLAAYVPAHRAATVDPVAALRTE